MINRPLMMLLLALAAALATGCGPQRDPAAMSQELIAAAEGGDLPALRRLIARGAELPDSDGVTPLQHARRRGYAAIERLLVEAGARR